MIVTDNLKWRQNIGKNNDHIKELIEIKDKSVEVGLTSDVKRRVLSKIRHKKVLKNRRITVRQKICFDARYFWKIITSKINQEITIL